MAEKKLNGAEAMKNYNKKQAAKRNGYDNAAKVAVLSNSSIKFAAPKTDKPKKR